MSYGESKIGTPWRGYYITAYGIAVKHGFKGTEEEWLESLVGKAVEIRYNDVTNVLEWSYAGEDVWTELLSLEDLQTEVVAQTLAQAEAAKQAAQNAQAAAEAAQSAAESAQQEAEQNAGITQADASITQTNVQLTKEAKAAAEAAQQAAQNAQQAAEAAQAAAETAETGAEESATLSKSWAVGGTGTRPGEDTNNAEYWARQAAIAAGGGVLTFNGRTGNVTPEQGDYTPDQVGAADKTLSNLTDYQRALHNIGGRPNQNFFINSFFVGGGSQLGNGTFPINQQEKNSYTGNNSIDRWIINNATLTIKQDGVEVFGSDIYGNFTQYLENFRYFAGKTVTLSALITGGTGIGNEAYLDILDGITEHTFKIDETGIISVTATLTDNITKLQAGVVTSSLSGKTLNVAAMKIELGNKQTLGYKDDSGTWKLFETPDYGEELAKCQRYGLFSGEGMLESVPMTVGYAMMPTPVMLRAKPVIVGNVVVYDINNNQPIPDATVSVHSVMGNGVLLQVHGTNGLVYVYFPDGSGLLAEL